jgi:uncharacterized membrane protein HdeD (DUF308 family)
MTVTQDYDLSEQAAEAAKQLAPWRTGLPWWGVLIEGIVVGGVGLLVLLDPGRANINLALALSAGLVVAGIMQFWAILNNQAPEGIDSAMSARAAIAVFAGALILLLYFLEETTVRGGMITFGLGAVVYGLLAAPIVLGTGGGQRRQALIEMLIFTAAGAVVIYTLFRGPEALNTAVTVAGWIGLLGGIALIILAIWRQQKGDEADELIESVTGSVSSAADAVTSFGRSDDQDDTA